MIEKKHNSGKVIAHNGGILFDLDDPVKRELEALGFEDDDEISIVEAKAANLILQDQKDDQDNDSKSLLSILWIQTAMWREHRKWRAMQRRAAWIIGITLSILGVLEKLGMLKLPGH